MIDLQRLRRATVWGVPFLLLTIVFIIWVFVNDVPSTINDLKNSAPSLRIAPLGLMMPIFTLLLTSLLVLIPLRLMQLEKAGAIAEKIMIAFLVILLFMAPILMIGGSLLQNHYLPDMGYHRCDELPFSRSIYSDHWVKDPKWCVRGKGHDWVREQAAKEQAAKDQPGGAK